MLLCAIRQIKSAVLHSRRAEDTFISLSTRRPISMLELAIVTLQKRSSLLNGKIVTYSFFPFLLIHYICLCLHVCLFLFHWGCLCLCLSLVCMCLLHSAHVCLCFSL